MNIRRNADQADDAYRHAVVEKESAARALYAAELAVHDAHQTHVDEWIRAAHDHLHIAVVRYTEADRIVSALGRPTLAA
jgi:hypothetical protein